MTKPKKQGRPPAFPDNPGPITRREFDPEQVRAEYASQEFPEVRDFR